MIKKCMGCGAVLQSKEPLEEGYIKDLDVEDDLLCRRCFRIKNYGDYQIINKDTKEYQEIFDEIKNKKDLILYLCDILSIDESLEAINDFKGNIMLVITKGDLLPKSVKERKLIKYINDNYNINVMDIIFVSSVKNYHLDLLMSKINKYKTSSKVYLIGNTNAGKSTLINRMLRSYSNNYLDITTSSLPATTLNFINAKIDDDLTLIDTPGIVNKDNYLTELKPNDVKIISPKTELKPKTYQMKPNQSLIIGSFARIDYKSDTKNSFTLYLSNDIKVNRINIDTNDYLRDLNKTSFNLKDNKDIVINGLCFCKIVKESSVDVYVKSGVKVYERNNLI